MTADDTGVLGATVTLLRLGAFCASCAPHYTTNSELVGLMNVIQPEIQVCLRLTSHICPSDLVATLTTTPPLLPYVLNHYVHLHSHHLTRRNPTMAQNEAIDAKVQPAEEHTPTESENTQSTPTPSPEARTRVLAAAIVLLASFVICCFLDSQISPIHQLWYKFGPVPPRFDESRVHVICGSPVPARPPWAYTKYECLTVSSGGQTRG
jgi:hypothetical protein